MVMRMLRGVAKSAQVRAEHPILRHPRVDRVRNNGVELLGRVTERKHALPEENGAAA